MAEPLHRTVRVRCSIAHAFKTFTEHVDMWWPPGHRKFDDSNLHLETFEGGRFFERSASGEEALLGEVLSCDPPFAISYSWYPGKVNAPTHVAVSFETDGGETIVNVLHSEGEGAMGDKWPERVKLFENGWNHVLKAFAAHAEGTSESKAECSSHSDSKQHR